MDVLILILLEDGFWFSNKVPFDKNGIGLNPYSTGRWFLIERLRGKQSIDEVLILILLEDGFWYEIKFGHGAIVLILILLEDGFWSMMNLI